MNLDDLDGPSVDDLAAVEAEWPLIAAELDLLYAETRALASVRPSELDLWRVRRAKTRVALAARTVATEGFAPVSAVAA